MRNSGSLDRYSYRVGAILSLTGHLAWLGVWKKKALELKVKLINDKGGINGKKVQAIIFNDGSNWRMAGKIAERLVVREGVLAIIGTASCPLSLEVSRVANKYKVPTFVNSGYLIDHNTECYTFNTAHRTDFTLLKAFKFFTQHGIKRVALLMPVGILGEVGSSVAKLVALKTGITIVCEERFGFSQKEIASCVARIVNSRCQAIFSFVTGLPALWVAKTLSQLKVKFPLLISHGNATPQFLKAIKGLDVTVIIPTGRSSIVDILPNNDPCRSVILDFDLVHRLQFGEKVNYYSAEIADAVDLICWALRQGAVNSREIKEAVEGLKNFVGMQGIYNFSQHDHYGTGIDDVFLLEIRDSIVTAHRVDVDEILPEDSHTMVINLNRRTSRGPLDKKSFGVNLASGYSNLKDQVDMDFLDSYTFINHKFELRRRICCGDEIGAKIIMNEILLLLERIENTSILRIALIELFFTVFDSCELVLGHRDNLSKVRSAFLKNIVKVSEREETLQMGKSIFNELLRIFFNSLSEVSFLQKVLVALKQCSFDSLSVSAVCKILAMSPSYVAQRLKKEYGITLRELKIRFKLQKAIQLLTFTDWSISRIAHEAGFSDQSYFTKVFKKYTAMTPRSYRANALANYRMLSDNFVSIFQDTFETYAKVNQESSGDLCV